MNKMRKYYYEISILINVCYKINVSRAFWDQLTNEFVGDRSEIKDILYL